MKSKIRLFNLIILITLVISCNNVKNRYNEMKAGKISGIIKEKYREKWNHGSPVVKLNTGKVFGVVSWAKGSSLWEMIEIGDSIIKPSGITNLTLYKKNGESFVFIFRE